MGLGVLGSFNLRFFLGGRRGSGIVGEGRRRIRVFVLSLLAS